MARVKVPATPGSGDAANCNCVPEFALRCRFESKLQPVGHTNQDGEGRCLHLAHDLGPVRFDRGFCCSDGRTDLLVELALNKDRQYLPLAIGEGVQPFAQIGEGAFLLPSASSVAGGVVRLYPRARLYAPPGLRKRRRDLRFDGDLNGAPVGAWARDIDQVAVKGSFAMTEVVFFHWPSRTAVFGGLIENFPPDRFQGWRSWVARLEFEPEQVVVAHGLPRHREWCRQPIPAWWLSWIF